MKVRKPGLCLDSDKKALAFNYRLTSELITCNCDIKPF